MNDAKAQDKDEATLAFLLVTNKNTYLSRGITERSVGIHPWRLVDVEWRMSKEQAILSS